MNFKEEKVSELLIYRRMVIMTNKSLSETVAQMLVASHNIYRKIGLITLIISILSSLSYLATYSFLYGYYFGGGFDNSFSNFDILRRIVPFHVNTLTFTWLIITLSMSLIIYALRFAKEKRFINTLIVLCLLIIFHILMTVFFNQKISIKNIIFFGVIWFFPIYVALMIFFIVLGTRTPFKALAGSFFGLILLFIIVFLFNLNLNEDWMTILVNLMFFTGGIVFCFIPYKKYINFIFILPFIFFLLIPLITFIDERRNIPNFDFIPENLFILFVWISLSVIISYLIAFRFKHKFVDNEKSSGSSTNKGFIYSTVQELFEGVMNPKTHKGVVAFILLFILFAYVMTPRMSIASAKIIRYFTPMSEFQNELITIYDLKGVERSIKGYVVAEQDGVIYISNENWELEQIKTDKYYIQRCSNYNDANGCKK
jgi:hypothetical protein